MYNLRKKKKKDLLKRRANRKEGKLGNLRRGGERERSEEQRMGDYHFVYKDVEGASTQWDDIQRKLGNLPPKPPAFKPPPFTPADDETSLPKDKSWLDRKTEDELEDLEDDADLDDDRFLEEYR